MSAVIYLILLDHSSSLFTISCPKLLTKGLKYLSYKSLNTGASHLLNAAASPVTASIKPKTLVIIAPIFISSAILSPISIKNVPQDLINDIILSLVCIKLCFILVQSKPSLKSVLPVSSAAFFFKLSIKL